MSGIVSHVDPERVEMVDLSLGNSAAQASQSMIALPFRALAVLTGILFAPFRFLLFAGMMGGRARDREKSVSFPVLAFRVVDGAGMSHDCVIRGHRRGGSIGLGDRVQIDGRLRRTTGSMIEVVSVQNLDTGSRTTAVLPREARGQGARAVLQLLLLVLLLLFVIGVFASCTAWLR